MQVFSLKLNDCLSFAPSFSGRSEEIKRADCLMRKAKQTFPMMSATYVDDFYATTKKGAKNKEKADEITQKLWDKIFALRRKCDEIKHHSKYSSFDKKLMYDLSQISKRKVGNCTECSKAALATLCANGYYNSSRVNLFYKVEFINKKTHKKEYAAASNLDHSFVVTDLNTRKKADIVIDTWLGFADYKSGAAARFKSVYNGDLGNFETMHKKLFNIEKLQKGEEIDFEDYEMRANFVFYDADYVFQSGKENLGVRVAEEYPEILLNVLV